MGTSDDWIGTTDEPTKEQGSEWQRVVPVETCNPRSSVALCGFPSGEFHMGSFTSAAHGNVLHVFSGVALITTCGSH